MIDEGLQGRPNLPLARKTGKIHRQAAARNHPEL